jgi:hypothetical protein
MANKSERDEYTLKLAGPGHTFERTVSEEIASQVLAFVLGGAVGTLSAGSARGSDQTNTQNSGVTRPASELQPKQFLATKKPVTDYERVACLGYYLTNVRSTPHFKTTDITKLATEAAYKFSNAANAVAHASATYKYLAPAGGGKKQMTALGEAIVEALPDRAKVQAAAEEFKPTKRRAVRSSKSKR